MFLFYSYAAVFGWTIILSGFWTYPGDFRLGFFRRKLRIPTQALRQEQDASRCSLRASVIRNPKNEMTKTISKEMVDGRQKKNTTYKWSLKKKTKSSKISIKSVLELPTHLIPFNFIINQPLSSTCSLMSRPPRESFESDQKGESITTSLFCHPNRIAGGIDGDCLNVVLRNRA